VYVLFKKALEEPLRIIVSNSGNDGSIVLEKVKEGKKDLGIMLKLKLMKIFTNQE